METKNIIGGIVGIVAVIVGVSFFGKPTVNVEVSPTPVNVNVPEQKTPVVNVTTPDVKIPAAVVNVPNLGAASGPDVNFRSFFNSGLTQGGRLATTSTAVTYTTRVNDFVDTPSVILWTPNINTTISLSSTSTLNYVPHIGDVATVRLLNASTTAASSITLAAVDANLDLQFTEATGGDLVLNGLDWAELTIIRQSAYKVSVLFNEFTEAD